MKENKYQQLFDMFGKARQVLKYPKIKFTINDGKDKVQLYLATKGYIAVKVNGTYCGKIMPDDRLLRIYPPFQDTISEINAFCIEPLAQSKIYGQRYSNCCFCGLELTNRASLQMGYGPICADKYGLPWYATEQKDEPLIDL